MAVTPYVIAEATYTHVVTPVCTLPKLRANGRFLLLRLILLLIFLGGNIWNGIFWSYYKRLDIRIVRYQSAKLIPLESSRGRGTRGVVRIFLLKGTGIHIFCRSCFGGCHQLISLARCTTSSRSALNLRSK